MKPRQLLISDVTKDSPLRLEIAAELAFPDGSMTVSGLRREAARGRLVIERMAGKDYTTLAAIEEMRRQCRVRVKDLDSISAMPEKRAAASLRKHTLPGSSDKTALNRV